MRERERLRRFSTRFRRKKVDAFLVTDPHNVRYLSGYTGGDGYLVLTRKGNFIITDARFIQEAGEVGGFKLRLTDGGFADTLNAVAQKARVRGMGFEGGSLSYRRCAALRRKLAGVRLRPIDGLVEDLRLIKDAQEIRAIRKCAAIARRVFRAVRRKIAPGVTEKRLAMELDYLVREHGADRNAFDTIVASGTNASRPHALPGNRRVGKNDMVLLDFGVHASSYNCDLTRVVFLGKIHQSLYDIYSICKEASRRAIRAIRPGVTAKDVDAAARGYIASKGYGKYFSHGLGHGVGLAVHELPRISPKADVRLQPNMVFTVEPGIYIEGLGGVRIEDMVVVTRKGCEVLTDGIPQ